MCTVEFDDDKVPFSQRKFRPGELVVLDKHDGKLERASKRQKIEVVEVEEMEEKESIWLPETEKGDWWF